MHAFSTQLSRHNMSEELIECFFKTLNKQTENIKRDCMMPDETITAWETVLWATMIQTNHWQLLLKCMEPYKEYINMPIPRLVDIPYHPHMWPLLTRLSCKEEDGFMYISNTERETVLLRLVRCSKYLQMQNRFEYVMHAARIFLELGADKSLKNSENQTAAELVMEIAQKMPEYYWEVRSDAKISNLLALHELLV